MTGRSTSRRALVAGGIGNVVEWYDFAVYGAFATAFLARPVGALVFGRLGDRVGRRQVLVTVIVLMAAATAGIGLLPGHAAIGVLAPALLVVLRTAQGLSVGGEAAGATAFVVEYAPEGRRGWYGSWLWSTLALGVAGGIGAAVVLARVFPRGVLEDRAWRLAFLVALPLGLVGLYLRVRLDDTPSFRAVERAGATARRPIADTLRVYPGRLLLGLAPVAAAALAGLLLVAVTAPAFGRLSDRVGRRPHLVAGTVGLVLAVLPAFLLIRRGHRSAWAWDTSWWRCRSAAWWGSALFGGTAPFLATLLVRRTGNPLVPVVYAAVAAAAAVLTAVASRETAFQPLADDRVGATPDGDRAGLVPAETPRITPSG